MLAQLRAEDITFYPNGPTTHTFGNNHGSYSSYFHNLGLLENSGLALTRFTGISNVSVWAIEKSAILYDRHPRKDRAIMAIMLKIEGYLLGCLL